MTVSLACDHAGFPLKAVVMALLQERGITVLDFGTDSAASVDYPDFAHPAARAVASGAANLGILLCGSGNGVAITANKHPEIRAALCWNAEIAAMARAHNDANMLALPARYLSAEEAIQILDSFLSTSFEGGRHAMRVGKIS